MRPLYSQKVQADRKVEILKSIVDILPPHKRIHFWPALPMQRPSMGLPWVFRVLNRGARKHIWLPNAVGSCLALS